MQVTYLGHSCFLVTIKGKRLLFDPFISPNGLTKNIIDADKIEADYILQSHGHYDHIADTVAIAQRTGAQVIAAADVAYWLEKQGVENIMGMNTGGKWNAGPFTVRCVVAQHSSSLPDGTYGGNPLGFLITSDEGNFYYSGDTGLTKDMELIPNWAAIDFAILPIGGHFTMDVDDASVCAQMTACKKVIGMHYDTFPPIKIDHDQAKAIFAAKGIQLSLMKIGENIEI